MAPAGQIKPTVEPRLSDRVAIGALTQTHPPGLVDQVLAQTGRRERRPPAAARQHGRVGQLDPAGAARPRP
jgi:hypothetical protein